MKEETFVFGGQEFVFLKGDKEWHLDVKRSDVATQELSDLLLLDLHHPQFLQQEMTVDEDTVHFTYHLDAFGQTFEDMKEKEVSEKLRLSLNVLELKQALKLPITFFVHPSSVFITKDGRAKLAYRAIPEKMVPQTLDATDLLKQLKSYILALFTEHDFMDLYNGALDVVPVPEFLDTIRKAEDMDSLEGLLQGYFQDKLEEEKATLTRVSRSKHRLYRYATIWLSALAGLLVLPLIYLVFMHNPFKEKMLDADTAFIKVDYPGVISELERVEVSSLPYTQKYTLAYAYIQGFDLSNEQRSVILNNVTLKSDEQYLDYWIEIGRGNSQEALDLAKRLDDSDLILYALYQQMEQVRENTTLSGEERETTLDELKAEYQKYWDTRTTILNEDGSQVETGTSSTFSSTSSTESSSTSPSSSSGE
ncbi:type VII secretion protein EssB [Streptococcus suis]|uniref:type VII secretion protein EssB n=1 Tax=Streptococcus suis TaxID=1307 RepID=UPI001960AF5C|nr:type VII secretion protein EssB [Streptococcus suis]MBM7153311.1 type VII secretion protein EssB [Streptococcus suis]MBM7178881.1 type VII secretion protein EssB [Streptococcus suis]MDG4503105.1 type VII secretion protein EssB [Streptococcus suis]MDW8711118.1 type VII secretion protein EssB [Streptococcus suis]HEL1633277.1 type VII secretion protein EssB [Streptococcus suis]